MNRDSVTVNRRRPQFIAAACRRPRSGDRYRRSDGRIGRVAADDIDGECRVAAGFGMGQCEAFRTSFIL